MPHLLVPQDGAVRPFARWSASRWFTMGELVLLLTVSASISLCADWVVAKCYCTIQDDAGIGSDHLELLDGENLPGRVQQIHKDKQVVDFQLSNGTRKTFRYSEIHAVTYRGKRFVITPKRLQGEDQKHVDQVTREELLKTIDATGNLPPDWFETTSLNYPETLDLSWPLNASGGWNSQKNVGQFLWDVVYPNEGRWKSGIKLVHHCLQLHQDDPALLKRDMETLGTMYFVLLQDYRRAAFWYQKITTNRPPLAKVRLAECYWRLGNPSMAFQLLGEGRLPVEAIKLFGEMNELDRARKLAEALAKSSRKHEAWLAIGDALRNAGALEEATDYYQQVLDNDQARNQEYKQRFDAMAKGGIESIQFLVKCNPSEIADGVYHAESIGYNGQLQLVVEVDGGKVTSVKVTKHREKQFYAALSDTPNKIIAAQSVEGIDGTSGATITSQAIVHATAKALANAPRK